MIGLSQIKGKITSGLETITPEDRGRAYIDAVPGCAKGNRSDEAYKLVAKLKDFGLECSTATEPEQSKPGRPSKKFEVNPQTHHR